LPWAILVVGYIFYIIFTIILKGILQVRMTDAIRILSYIILWIPILTAI
jgi:hypothetical protein